MLGKDNNKTTFLSKKGFYFWFTLGILSLCKVKPNSQIFGLVFFVFEGERHSKKLFVYLTALVQNFVSMNTTLPEVVDLSFC